MAPLVSVLIPCFNSEPMRYARRMLLGVEPPRDDIPCTTYDSYRHRRQARYWIRFEGAPADRRRA